MNHLHLAALGVAVSFTIMHNAVAQDDVGRQYIGGNIGQSEIVNYCNNATACDGADAGVSIYGGYNFHQNFALEYGFAYLGEFKKTRQLLSNAQTTTRQINELSTLFSAGVGKINVNEKITLFGKIGVHRWFSDATFTNTNPRTLEDDGVDLFYGVGGQISLNEKIKLILDYSVFRITDAHRGQILVFSSGGGYFGESDTDIEQFNVGFTYTF